MVNKTQLRVETVGDGSNARADFQKTEAQVGQLEKSFGGLQSKLLGLASSASGLDLSKIGGLASGVIGTAGEAAGGLASGGGLAALAGPAAAAVAGLGALVVVGKEATGSVITLAGETKKLARETGLSVETTSALLAVFKRFGVDGAEASKELGLFSKQMGGYQLAQDEGIAGGKKFGDSMKALGVDFRDAHGNLLPMDATLFKVADRFKAMPDGVEKTALSMSLFGRGGKDMLPILNQGAAGITELMATAKELGLTLTGDNMAAVKQYGLAHKDMNEAFEGMKITVGTLLMPALAELAKEGKDLAVGVNTVIVPALKGENEAINALTGKFQGLADILTKVNQLSGSAGADLGTKLLETLRDIPNDRSADDPMTKWLNEQIANRHRLADEAAAGAKNDGKKVVAAATESLDDPAAKNKAKGYGSDLLTAYVQGLNPEGLTIYGDLKKVVEDGLKASSPDGKVDNDKLKELAPLFAKVADEIARTGAASDESWAALQTALGGESSGVRELVTDYAVLAANKRRVKEVTDDLHAAEKQQRADAAEGAREGRELQRGITEAQRNQTEADKAEAANIAGLTEAQKALGAAQKDAAAGGVAALVPLNTALKDAQEQGAAVALGYKAQNDELQRQIDLNNQIVGQLEHQRDVKFLAIDERLAEIGKSRDVNDLREAATLRRERAQIERNTKPQIDLERERATVENYGLTQAQKGIADKAKQASDASAAQIQSLQAQITKQAEHNAQVQAGFQAQIEAGQKVIDTTALAAKTRHDDDAQRIVDLQEVATATAQFWQDRQAADTDSVTAARDSLTFWQAQVTEANTVLNTIKAINTELAAAGNFHIVPNVPHNLTVDSGYDDGGGAIPGATHDRTVDSGYGDGSGATGPGRGGGGGGGAGFTELKAPTTYHINAYGVGEADFLDKLTAAIDRVSAA